MLKNDIRQQVTAFAHPGRIKASDGVYRNVGPTRDARQVGETRTQGRSVEATIDQPGPSGGSGIEHQDAFSCTTGTPRTDGHKTDCARDISGLTWSDLQAQAWWRGSRVRALCAGLIAAMVVLYVVGMLLTPHRSGPAPAPYPTSPPAHVTLAATASPVASADPQPAVTGAVRAYRRMLRDFGQVQRNPNRDVRLLTHATTGQALRTLTGIVTVTRQRGLRSTGVSRSISIAPTALPDSPTATSSNGLTRGSTGKATATSTVTSPITQVVVRGCLDTSRTHLVRVNPDAPPYRDSPGGRRHITAHVKVVDGTSKVTRLAVSPVGTC